MKVLIRSVRDGSTKRVSKRDAKILVLLGKYSMSEDEPVQPATPDLPSHGIVDLKSLSYNELRSMAAEQGVTPEGRTKDDYLRALKGTYNRRDMRAED